MSRYQSLQKVALYQLHIGITGLGVSNPIPVSGYGAYARVAKLKRLARWLGFSFACTRCTWSSSLGPVTSIVCVVFGGA